MKFPLMPVVVVVVFAAGFFSGRLSAPVPATATSAPVAAAPVMPPPVAPSAPGDSSTLTGVVAEVLQVPNYTYLRLSTQAGDDWAAVSTTSTITAGQTITVRVSTRMQNFASKSLGRTFDSIVFGELGAGGAAAAGPGPVNEGAALPAGHPPVGAPGAAPQDTVARALDATRAAEPALSMRVADVFSERQMLQGRVVKVSGTVSRATSVAGVHYGHLKDGSGASASQNDDLVVISTQPLTVDQRVSLQGTVVLDKESGMGTKWPVALDRATVAP
ncbi:MAG: hypothetical protein Q8N26_12690 [Myxococcales bacterium]|nr:hypothetical protein [Myxococcales bacterium]